MERLQQVGDLTVDMDPDDTAPTDHCFVCDAETRPWKMVTSKGLSRGYFECRAVHPHGELARWWTHWRDSELVDRAVIIDPAMLGGTNLWTWSALEVGTKWGRDLDYLLPDVSPRAAANHEG
jgi:hypothetical protein